MVCEQDLDSKHDFTKSETAIPHLREPLLLPHRDPIVPRVVDDKLMATGTTLGADNGSHQLVLNKMSAFSVLSRGWPRRRRRGAVPHDPRS